MWHSMPTTSAPRPFPLTLLHNYCVLFMASNIPVKEVAAMQVHPARAAPPLEHDALIAPHQLWGYLSIRQQQHVRKVLVGVAHQLLAHLSSPPPTEEAPYAP